jgi:hypothetical protein
VWSDYSASVAVAVARTVVDDKAGLFRLRGQAPAIGVETQDLADRDVCNWLSARRATDSSISDVLRGQKTPDEYVGTPGFSSADAAQDPSGTYLSSGT